MPEMKPPVRSIREYCIHECAGGSRSAVRHCSRASNSSRPCPLYRYRMGKNPARAGIGRVLSSEDARITRKRTSQGVDLADINPTPQDSTPEIDLGHPRAKDGADRTAELQRQIAVCQASSRVGVGDRQSESGLRSTPESFNLNYRELFTDK